MRKMQPINIMTLEGKINVPKLFRNMAMFIKNEQVLNHALTYTLKPLLKNQDVNLWL